MTARARKRTLTDEEISLVKAMLSRGMRNDAIHFYFNRADRLISSGRIAQIKKNKYGASVPEAESTKLDAFLKDWQIIQETLSSNGSPAPTSRAILLGMFTIRRDSVTMHVGETDQIECKQSFRLNPEYRFGEVVRAIAGLANNKGGYIFFGIRNASFEVDGLADNAFAEADPASVNRVLAGALDPVPRLSKSAFDIGSKTVGVLHVEKHPYTPVVALKNIGSDVKEGTIYYRYVGETRAIKPGELRQIIAERERRAVAEFSQRMSRIASGNEATIDLDTGEVTGKSGRFVIAKDLLPSIQFVREGDFSDIKGAPALRLIGDVEPISEVERERARIIRDNVTPDAVIRNFLRNESVADPMQYIHFQAHAQRRWLPVWYYVDQASVDVSAIVDDLKSQVATYPASRDAVVQRLLRATSAHKIHVGRPAEYCAQFLKGEITAPATVAQDGAFANAIQGLPKTYTKAEAFRSMLLISLDRAQGLDSKSGNRRSAIYRAACRLDELIYIPRAAKQS